MMIFGRIIFVLLFTLLLQFLNVDSKKSSNSKTGGSTSNNNNNNFQSGNIGSKSKSNLNSGGGITGSKGGLGSFKSPTSNLVAAGLVGAAAGAGGALLISAATNSYHSSVGRTYYYGDRYYRSPTSPYRAVCRYNISPNDTRFQNITYEDKTRIKEIIYECDTRSEVCCDGLDCCKRGDPTPAKTSIPWWGSLIIVLIFAGVFALAGYCIWMKVKRRKGFNHSQPDVTYVVSPSTGYSDMQNPQTSAATGFFPQQPAYNNPAYTGQQPQPNYYPAQPSQQSNYYPAQPPQQPQYYSAQPPQPTNYGQSAQNPVNPQQVNSYYPNQTQQAYNPQFAQPQQWNQPGAPPYGSQ